MWEARGLTLKNHPEYKLIFIFNFVPAKNNSFTNKLYKVQLNKFPMDGKSWSWRLAALRRRNRAQEVLYISTNFFRPTFYHGSF